MVKAINSKHKGTWEQQKHRMCLKQPTFQNLPISFSKCHLNALTEYLTFGRHPPERVIVGSVQVWYFVTSPLKYLRAHEIDFDK